MVQTRRTKRNHLSKRTRRTKRTRGGMNNNASDSIRNHLRTFFPEFNVSRFVIKESDDDYKINLTKCEEQAQHSQRYSPRISIFKDGRMHIERLTSCKPLSGPEMIGRYISLAHELGLHSITLDDESEVYFPRSRYGDERCAVYLPILRILLKGQSWYESLGFISQTSEEEKAQNEKVRQMPFGEFVQLLIVREHQKEKERIVQRYALNNNNAQRNREMAKVGAKKSVLEGLHDTFPEISAPTPVYQAIQHMVNHVNASDNACESEPFRMLQHVINMCIVTKDPLIHYRTRKLTMTL
jgi:hypothetical protein